MALFCVTKMVSEENKDAEEGKNEKEEDDGDENDHVPFGSSQWARKAFPFCMGSMRNEPDTVSPR